MSAIITADTHWNDNPRDESRWGLLDWLAEQQANELIILGDMTVAKNNHPARVVNRLVDGFRKLAHHYQHVYILKGNHDYADPNCPFFGFLQHTRDNITFIPEPAVLDLSIGQWLFMPAGTNWSEHETLITNSNIFAHATFDGAISETGYQLTGVSPHIVTGARSRVISGDIHKPQKLAGGAIEYVGAPYHCHFGDQYVPRVLYMHDSGEHHDLHYPAPRKYTQIIKSLAELDRIAIKEGDQIKIIAEMRRADLPEWKLWREAIKACADAKGWVLFGPELKLQQDESNTNKSTNTTRQSHAELIAEYAKRQQASERHLQIGQALIEEVR